MGRYSLDKGAVVGSKPTTGTKQSRTIPILIFCFSRSRKHRLSRGQYWKSSHKSASNALGNSWRATIHGDEAERLSNGLISRLSRVRLPPSPPPRQLGYEMDFGLGFEPGTGEFDSHYPCQICPVGPRGEATLLQSVDVSSSLTLGTKRLGRGGLVDVLPSEGRCSGFDSHLPCQHPH